MVNPRTDDDFRSSETNAEYGKTGVCLDSRNSYVVGEGRRHQAVSAGAVAAKTRRCSGTGAELVKEKKERWKSRSTELKDLPQSSTWCAILWHGLFQDLYAWCRQGEGPQDVSSSPALVSRGGVSHRAYRLQFSRSSRSGRTRSTFAWWSL